MKSIKQRITKPLILSAILIPLAVLLVFNGIMRIYLIQTARHELKQTATVTQSLIAHQLKDAAASTELQSNAQLLSQLENVRSILYNARQISGIDLLVLGPDRSIVWPAQLADLDLGNRILLRLENRFRQNLVASSVETVHTLAGQVLFIGYPVQPAQSDHSVWIVFFTRYSPARGILLYINLILLGILVAGSLFSSFLAIQTAQRIRKPLLSVAKFAGLVGQGNFTAAQPDTYCTEIHNLQDQFNLMTQRLACADQLQKKFLQDASHELRTPLQVIQGYAEGLESGVLKDVPAAAGTIKAESRRLNTLVESLLALSRIENQAWHLQKSRVDLAHWLEDQIQRFKVLAVADGKSVELLLDLPAAPVVIEIDENLLEQIINNLLVNAIRYAEKKIDIRLVSQAGSAVITVHDDGPGIHPENLPHLFDRFYKGDQGQFGLGLAIAKAASEAMNGNLTAQNDPAGGAVFRLTL